jgi:hypothetical protein
MEIRPLVLNETISDELYVYKTKDFRSNTLHSSIAVDRHRNTIHSYTAVDRHRNTIHSYTAVDRHSNTLHSHTAVDRLDQAQLHDAAPVVQRKLSPTEQS